MIYAKRNTGRTSRMLERARLLAQQGRAVYVIAANGNHANELRHTLGCDENGSIRVETVASVMHSLDWYTLTLRCAHPNCAVLVDHHTIESRFATILGELTRYDQDSTGTKEPKP